MKCCSCRMEKKQKSNGTQSVQNLKTIPTHETFETFDWTIQTDWSAEKGSVSSTIPVHQEIPIQIKTRLNPTMGHMGRLWYCTILYIVAVSPVPVEINDFILSLFSVASQFRALSRASCVRLQRLRRATVKCHACTAQYSEYSTVHAQKEQLR